MQAGLRAEFSTQERSSTAQTVGFSLLLLFVPLLVILWAGWQPWMIALPLLTVPLDQARGEELN